MITNLEIDDGLASQVESAARAQGISTRDFIRAVLRQAVDAPITSVAPACFRQKVHDFGTHLESPWMVLVDIESEEYIRNYSRK